MLPITILTRRRRTFGQAPLWSPAALGVDLSVWLDAEDESTIVLNGSTVSLWKDKSGNGRDASQTTASKQPIYQNGLFGQNTLAFDGATDQLDFAAPSATSGPYSVFILFAPKMATPLSANFKSALSHASATAGAFQIQATQATPTTLQFSAQNDAPATRVATLTNYTQNMKVIVELLFSSSNFSYTVNGGALSTAADTYTLGRNKSMRIGVNRGSNVYMEMDFAELVITSGVPTTDDRNRIEGYLAWKWGTTENLPDTHPYKTFPPMG